MGSLQHRDQNCPATGYSLLIRLVPVFVFADPFDKLFTGLDILRVGKLVLKLFQLCSALPAPVDFSISCSHIHTPTVGELYWQAFFPNGKALPPLEFPVQQTTLWQTLLSEVQGYFSHFR